MKKYKLNSGVIKTKYNKFVVPFTNIAGFITFDDQCSFNARRVNDDVSMVVIMAGGVKVELFAKHM